jgi:hypothetical protein
MIIASGARICSYIDTRMSLSTGLMVCTVD